MDFPLPVVTLLLGLAIGGGCIWFVMRQLLQTERQSLSNSFQALAADALRNNNQSFLDLARTKLGTFQSEAQGDLEKRKKEIEVLVGPLKLSLDKVEATLNDLEVSRVGAYSGLTTQVNSLIQQQKDLRTETANLVKALRTPNVRGRWGEIQLRRVVEMAGMLNCCDFFEQQSIETEEGRQRPDVLVRLPGNKSIVVDSKVPLSAYLEAIEATDDEIRKAKLDEHAKQIRCHLRELGKKSYFNHVEATPEFVVMFIPGESIFYAALMQDPSLIEAGNDQNIIIATPTTLIGLLRAVAYGWRQEQLAQNAKQISALGKELFDRCSTLGEKMLNVGKSLRKATDSYNEAVGSLEGRVLVTARKFADLGAVPADATIEGVPPIEVVPRQLQAPELLRVLADGEANGTKDI